MTTFKKLIKQRKLLRVRQNAMAAHLGISDTTMNRYEKGTREISAAKQDDYADKLGYKLDITLK